MQTTINSSILVIQEVDNTKKGWLQKGKTQGCRENIFFSLLASQQREIASTLTEIHSSSESS